MVIVRWCLCWLVLAIGLLMLVTGQPIASLSLFGTNCPLGSTLDHSACPTADHPCLKEVEGVKSCVEDATFAPRVIILVVLMVVEILTLLGWIYYLRVYPYLIRRGWLKVRTWWKLTRMIGHRDVFKYRTFRFCGSSSTCRYKGGLDAQNRPHGWGQWLDDSFNGESLRGLWSHGVPIGPFQTREYGSSSAFTCLRVGFATCREDQWKQSAFFPKPAPLEIGVASVECCISGSFFHSFPLVRLVLPPVYPASLTDPFKTLFELMPHNAQNEPITSVVVTADSQNGLVISGHFNNNGSDRTDQVVLRAASTSTSTRAASWRSSFQTDIPTTPHVPVALQVEGWTCAANSSREAVIFIPGYNTSLEASLERFGQLLCLGDFPSHLKPICFSYPAGRIFSYYFAMKQGAAHPNTGQCLKELLLGLREGGCRDIHFMVHSMGAQASLGNLSLLAEVFLGSDPSPMRMRTVMLLNPDYPRELFVDIAYPLLRQMCHRITMYADRKDGALKWSERVHVRRVPGQLLPVTTPSLGLAVLTMITPKGYLDMDVIDTTLMENNVHAIRHNYFNINRELVDDLRDVIVLKNRASQRPRLQKREGNVYSLLMAPPCVVNS
eukprot:NODE_492_length_2153_cov_32.290721_g456_i0.p1 GENE.NODE_492_length_2153_cov_32.290721_g456_i0~~NODE_492_length_2153_cov_32.290721_g456_i0.p1  ORF type:complete len:701 (+),score=192.58 NODE_492_length_2153_cov_32.290721_g456_i0:278-2104(+)